MKIGVYIGSFNPVHNVHIKIVNDLINNNIMDKIIVIPASSSYHLKSGLEDFSHRHNMLKLAFNSDKVIVSELEKEKYHFTFENIMILKDLYKNDDLYLIIGADNLIELNTWKNYEYLLDNCNFIVIGRDDIDTTWYINNSFTNYKNKFIIMESIYSMSSTYIRENLNKNIVPNDCLNEKVLDYIKKNNLYGWRD